MRTRPSLSLVSLVAAGVGLVAASSQQPTFRRVSDGVLIDVQVTSRGRPIGGLTAADFELNDSGVVQEIQVVTFTDVPISLMLALDISSSVEGEPLAHLKNAAKLAVSALRPADEAAILAFSADVTLRAEWTRDRHALAAAIDRLRPRGWTSLHDAVLTSIALRESAAGRMVLLIFTDGADTSSWLDPQSTIRAGLRSDLVVTAVSAAPRPAPRSAWEAQQASGLAAAVQRWFDSDSTLFPYVFLERLTEETGGELLYTTASRDLSRAFEKIVSDFKTRYLISYVPKGVAPSGWHPVSVRVKGRSADVRARRGYWR